MVVNMQELSVIEVAQVAGGAGDLEGVGASGYVKNM